jgi:hypothetical protein
MKSIANWSQVKNNKLAFQEFKMEIDSSRKNFMNNEAQIKRVQSRYDKNVRNKDSILRGNQGIRAKPYKS